MDAANRGSIESGLAQGDSLRKIAKAIERDLSTVAREIRKHTYESFKYCYGRKNQCEHRTTCSRTLICATCPAAGARCAACSLYNCNRKCPEVRYIDCSDRLLRAGQVCNGCPKEKNCHKRKLFYIAGHAQEDRMRVLSESRQGAAIEPKELETLDELVSPKIKDGQSVHHICVTNADQLMFNERTIQRYVNYGILSAKRGDLKRACMIRQRKALAKEYQHKVETGCYVNRTPYDLFEFLHGAGVAARLHITKTDPKEVKLKPSLIGIEVK